MQRSASIQPRTSPPNFGKHVQKFASFARFANADVPQLVVDLLLQVAVLPVVGVRVVRRSALRGSARPFGERLVVLLDGLVYLPTKLSKTWVVSF